MVNIYHYLSIKQNYKLMEGNFGQSLQAKKAKRNHNPLEDDSSDSEGYNEYGSDRDDNSQDASAGSEEAVGTRGGKGEYGKFE